ncbi:hypothetical protein EYZ11_000001 [Aspergillus tanneri]|uniref:Uncharacterized protein n=1 Tax=Aspergillus tanneri TaxID=1220188 RepID=A0A4S3JY02_9EURO|nr:hypothetical protein EYZ11_000001 [Aspergillus tanneri]
MSANNFHTTIQDLRKEESKLAQAHVGKPLTGRSADHITVNVGSGHFEGPVSGEGDSTLGNLRLQQPVSGSWEMNENQNTEPFGNFGRQGKDNLGRLPKDALTR